MKTHSVPIKSEAVQEADEITYIPRHMRQEMTAGTATTTPNRKEQAPKNLHGATNGLNTPIQTPVQQAVNLNRGQYRQTEPSLPQPEQRPVPPTEQTAAADEIGIPDADETSYSLDSDDDAFYATVDLGDGDLGRPINFEEGSGGVNVSYISSDREDADTSKTLRESPNTLQGNSLPDRSSSNSGGGEATTAGISRFSLVNAPSSRVQAKSSTTSRTLRGVDNAAGAPMAPPPKPEPGSKFSSSEAKRVVPSLGRFDFPPGVVRSLSLSLTVTHNRHRIRLHNQNHGCLSLRRYQRVPPAPPVARH